MGYYIYASLENGDPQLEIVDADSKSTCLSWRYQSENSDKNYDKKEIQRLFRELLLLTCKQEINNYRVFGLQSIKNKEDSGCMKELIVA